MQLLATLPLILAPFLAAASQDASSGSRAPLSVELSANLSETRTAVIGANETASWDLWLPSDEVTRITVRGDGDSDLDAYLLDENGNVVDFDDDYTDLCLLTVKPRWTGAFTLVIVNHGMANLYELSVD